VLGFDPATGEFAPVGEDTAAPGGTLTAPTIVKLKRQALKLDLTAPTTNNLRLRRANVYIADGPHGSATRWLNPADLTTFVTSEGNGIPTAPTGGVTIPVDRATLETIFPGGTISVYATWTNDVNTSVFSGANSYALSGGETGAIGLDSGVPSGLVPIPFIKVKKGGTHIRFTLPTTNANTHTHNLVVVGDTITGPASGVKVLNASNLSALATLSSTDDTIGRIDAGRKKTTLEVDRAQLESLFGVGATIYFWWYAVNSFGPSAIGGVTSYNLATGEASPISDDAGPPGGTLTTPVIIKLKKSALKLDLTAPTTNNLRLRYANVYIANNIHTAPPTKWVKASDLTSAETAVEANGAIRTNPTGGVSIPIDRTALEAIFGGGATIYVYAQWHNDQGDSGYSDAATYVLSNGELLDSDTPSGLATPTVSASTNAKQVTFVARNMHADINNTTHKKTEVVFHVVNDAQTINIGYLDPDTGANSPTSEVRIDIGRSGHYRVTISRKQLLAAFGGPSDRNIRLIYYVWNALGQSVTSSPFSNILPFSSFTTDELQEDSGGASAVQNLSLVFGAKKKGYKATWDRPASNIKSLKGYKVAFSDNAGTNWMYPETVGANLQGALAPNEAAATVFVTDTRYTTGIERSQLASQFAAGVKVKITPVNVVNGVDTDGTAATSSFVAPSGEDTAGPGAVQNLTLVWSNKKGWKATWERPATNVASLIGYKVVFFDNAGTSFMNPVTGALNSPNTEVGATKLITELTYPTLLKYSQLVSPFTSGVKVKVTPVNVIQGVETDGTSTTSSLVAPSSDDPLSSDPAAPSGLSAPTIDWTAAGRLRVRGMFASTDINTLKKKYLVIATDRNINTSTVYMDIANRAQLISQPNDLAARFEFGLKSHLQLVDIKRKVYSKDVFGLGANFIAYWYAENGFGISAPSAASNALSVPNLNDFLSDGRDAVNVLDVGATLLTAQNMIVNGDFLYNDGTTTNTNWWLRGATVNGALFITPNPANAIYWNNTNAHELVWQDNSRNLYQSFKKRLVKGGEYYALTFLLRTSGSFAAGSLITIDIVSDVSGSDVSAVQAPATVDLGVAGSALNGSFQLFGVLLQTNGTADFTINKFLKFSTSLTLNGTNNIIIDKVMMVRGKQPLAYGARSDRYEGDGTNPAGGEDITQPTQNSTVSTADLGSPSGATRGGWLSTGTGGPIGIQTL